MRIRKDRESPNELFIARKNFGKLLCPPCSMFPLTYLCDHGFGEYGTVTKAFTDSQGTEHRRGKDYRGLTPYMLRHGQATVLCAQGVEAKTAQGRLGHSNFSTTMNIYTHFQQDDRRASQTFQSALPQG